jgi:hypothetical protein
VTVFGVTDTGAFLGVIDNSYRYGPVEATLCLEKCAGRQKGFCRARSLFLNVHTHIYTGREIIMFVAVRQVSGGSKS